MSTIEQLKEIIDNYNGEDNEVTMDSVLTTDLALSSLSLFEILNLVEDEFGIRVKDEDIASFHTVGDVVNYIDAQK